jgi:hypothetical protein
MGVQSSSTDASVSSDPLNPLCILKKNTVSTRMNPRYCSESVSLKNLLAGQIFIASKHLVLEERITTC